MSKIKINSIVFGKETTKYEISTNGIKKDSIITYKDDNSLVNITILDDIVSIKRENNEMIQNLKFEKGKQHSTNYYIKDLNMDIILKTNTNDLITSNNNIRVEYDLFMNDEFSDTFTFTLEWSDL